MVVFLLFTHTFPVAHKMSKYVSIIDEINLKSNRFIYELMVSIMDVDKSQNKLILVHFVSFFALLFLRVLFFIVRPRKIEVSSNFDQHTIQGSQVILLCKVSTNEWCETKSWNENYVVKFRGNDRKMLSLQSFWPLSICRYFRSFVGVFFSSFAFVRFQFYVENQKSWNKRNRVR